MSPSPQKTAGLLSDAMEAHRRGDWAGAERGYRAILKASPLHADALHLLGLVYDAQGNTAKALEIIAQALKARPDFAAAHLSLGNVFANAGDDGHAEAHYRQAIRLNPNDAVAHHNLGQLAVRAQKPHDAVPHFEAAIACDPRFVDAHLMLAESYRLSGELQALLRVADRGLKFIPDQPELWTYRTEAQFLLGHLEEGWRSLWRCGELRRRGQSLPALPLWRGEDLTGRGILLRSEGSLGEDILYATMIPEVAARANRCVIHCSQRLATLFRRSFPLAQVTGHEPSTGDLSGLTAWSPLADLGGFLRASFEHFPQAKATLAADAGLTVRLRQRYLSGREDRLLVGIAWRSVGTGEAVGKTVNLGEWGSVLQVPGVTFVNLQYGECSAALDAVRKGFNAEIIEDCEIDPLGDVDMYAAQIAALDLVVTSSNMAAHLAGALGIPTFCLVPRTLGLGLRWYWFGREGASPWYPSLRLFVQVEEGSWLRSLRDVSLAVLDAVRAKGAPGNVADFLRALAKGFGSANRREDADVIYRRLAAEPVLTTEDHYMIGGAWKRAGEVERGLAAYSQAIAADPDYWHAYVDKGSLLSQQHRGPEAIACLEAGLHINPRSPELHNNLGLALRTLGKSPEALDHYRAAMELNPGIDQIKLNAAAVLDDLGRTGDSIALIDDYLTQHPDDVDAHYNRAITLLSAGRLEEGWREFEWRLKRPAANVRYEYFPLPRWRGEDLAGKHVVIWTEQGIGDEIMSASMVPDVIEAAAAVTFLCSDRMIPLFRRSFPKARVMWRADPSARAAGGLSADLQMSQGDLGTLLRPSVDAFPSRRSFLAADPLKRQDLRDRYVAAHPNRRLIGISWNSSKNPEVGPLKSLKLIDLAPILGIPGVSFVNLQYGDCTAEISQVRRELGVEVVQDPEVNPLTDMDAFAAQVAAMDLVISVSNTTVHTAGGLGVPTWTLLPEGRGRIWYWFRDRSLCLWYPSVRFIRQPAATAWAPVVAQAATDLAAWLARPLAS